MCVCVFVCQDNSNSVIGFVMYHHRPGICFWRQRYRRIDSHHEYIQAQWDLVVSTAGYMYLSAVCVCVSTVVMLWTPNFSKGGRVRRITGGPQRDPLEMETPLQKTLSLHKMEGGGRRREGRVDRG